MTFVRSVNLRQTAALFLWAVALLLVYWVARSVSIAESLSILGRLGGGKALFLVCVNALVLLTFSGRWWVLLRSLGHPIPYLTLAAYRLAAYGVSYFTPGPLFGGEPLQVYFLHRRHQVPAATAVTALALDKAIELLANFVFLVIGVFLLMRWQLFPAATGRQAMVAALALLSLPTGYLIALFLGKASVTTGVRWLWAAWNRLGLGTGGRYRHLAGQVHLAIIDGETQAIRFCREDPRTLAVALLFSILSWLGLISEYALVLRLLGLDLTLVQTLLALTAARFAILLPLPGGLGTIEASQVLALGILGFNPAAGLSLSVFIRLRDVLVAGFGLWLGWQLRGPTPDRRPSL